MEKETIEELFWIEIIVDEFYFPILFYFEWKNSREESKKLSLLLRNCWRENWCISLLCFASWIVANSWKTQATDREVENEVAKSSLSWKRCSAVRKYLSLRTRRQKERIFDPRARTAAASPHSCSSPNLQTSHKVRLLARSHLHACQCSEEERSGVGFGEGGRARHRRCPPAAPARCSRSGWVHHLVPLLCPLFRRAARHFKAFFSFFFLK